MTGNRIHITNDLEQVIRMEIKTTENKLATANESRTIRLTGFKDALKWVLEQSRLELDE
jgi:hypothetical protein